MVSDLDGDPARFDDREWITAPYTTDGRTVHALVHDEYQGDKHPGRCPSEEYLKCWYNSITLARSTDGGRTFTHAAPPRHLVASVPYRYEPDAGPFGLFQPSNIVRRPEDGYYYALIRAQAYGAQRGGTCVMRTATLGPARLLAGLGRQRVQRQVRRPYTVSAASAATCARRCRSPRSPAMTDSLTYNTYLDKYVLVVSGGGAAGRQRAASCGASTTRPPTT